jgi:hypothetical protein
MRILITGSRDWTDTGYLWTRLHRVMEDNPDEQEFTYVHGGARGADMLVEKWVEFIQPWAEHVDRVITTEVHPAEWRTYGKRAGFVRNREMVEAGADLCLAFIKDESKGATMTANMAEKNGIITMRYTA